MLKEFRLSNFKSIKDEVLFTMEPDKDVSEFKSHIYENKHGDKLLKVASMYGPNAGGKTTFLKAIAILKTLVNTSRRFYAELEILATKMMPDFEPFLFCEKSNETIEINVFFIDECYELGYSFKFDKLKDDDKFIKVQYESLTYRKLGADDFQVLFKRHGDKIDAKLLAKEAGVKTFRISDDILFISYIFDLYVKKSSSNKRGMGLVKRLLTNINAIDYMAKVDDYNRFEYKKILFALRENDVKNKVLAIINKLDISISDIAIRVEDGFFEVFCEHNVDGYKIKLNLNDESKGTIVLILLLLKMIRVIKTGGILLIDELDAHLHPKIITKLIELFKGELNTRAQLIFNSHDIWNMNKDNFRRDEIWFIYRNEKLATELVCLSDFINYKGERVRKDSKFSKQYMEGKYGADPFISKGGVWDE